MIPGFYSWVGKFLWRREWQSTSVFLPIEFHGQRSLAGYSPRDHKESDTTEQVNCTDNAAWECKGKKAMCVLVVQSCPTLHPHGLCTSGFPDHQQLLELAQIHVHRVGNGIKPSHSLPSLSPPAFNLSYHRVFSNDSVFHIRWPKYWSFSFSINPSNEYSGLI